MHAVDASLATLNFEATVNANETLVEGNVLAEAERIMSNPESVISPLADTVMA